MSDGQSDATSDRHGSEHAGGDASEAAGDGGGDRDAGIGDAGNGDAGADETTPGIVQAVWQCLVAAGTWVADTFRGHSGARELKRRDE